MMRNRDMHFSPNGGSGELGETPLDLRNLIKLKPEIAPEVADIYYREILPHSLKRLLFPLEKMGIKIKTDENGTIEIITDPEKITDAEIIKTFVLNLIKEYLTSEQQDEDLNLAKTFSEIKEVGNTDPLTEMPNRRGSRIHFKTMTDNIPKLLENDEENLSKGNEVKSGWGVGFIFLDIDRFKRINDEHGDSGGDEVIKAVIRRMKSSVRKIDIVGREGGEELIIVVSHVTPDELKRSPKKCTKILP